MNCNLGNWSSFCEKIVNDQINLEFWASYQYHLMWSYFDRSDVGLTFQMHKKKHLFPQINRLIYMSWRTLYIYP